MSKVVLLPLDERPCNYMFPYKLFNRENFQVVRPPKLGDKKKPADVDGIIEFLRDNCRDADYLVISMDTLLYGGLIPSRLHYLDRDEVKRRLEIIKELKETNRKLKIYAFQCIMRCPTYSSSDEEPDYYDICGAQIHKIGVLRHKQMLGMDVKDELDKLYREVKEEYLEDYLQRRRFNLEFNKMTLEYLKDSYIDFLILPQDDSAEYGFTAMDQEIIYGLVSSWKLRNRVYVYPGADEIGLTLLSRVTNEIHQRVPKVFVRYASIKAPFMVPAYEDRPLAESLKYHIMAAGCCQVYSENEADLILAVTAPSEGMKEARIQPVNNKAYCVERNITELMYYVEEMIKHNKNVVIADNAYANGADLEVIDLLNRRNLLMEVAGYAGWNTSANTIGTALSEGIQYLYYGKTREHMDFLALRYVEDAGYCSVVRSYVTDNELEALGMNYFDVKESDGYVSKRVKELLTGFVNERLSSVSENIEISSVYMPWRRMFEVGLDVRFRQ